MQEAALWPLAYSQEFVLRGAWEPRRPIGAELETPKASRGEENGEGVRGRKRILVHFSLKNLVTTEFYIFVIFTARI